MRLRRGHRVGAEAGYPTSSAVAAALPTAAAGAGACDGDQLCVDQQAALGFGEAAPDAVRLTDAERVVEALGLHRALATDRLGLGFAQVALVLALRRRRREEQRRLRAPARGAQLPRAFRHL